MAAGQRLIHDQETGHEAASLRHSRDTKSPALLDRTAASAISPAHVAISRRSALDPASLKKLRQTRRSKAAAAGRQGNPRFGPCVAGTGKFICIGLNYSDHAAETGATVPPEPIIFMKATSAICGPNDDVVIPRGSTKTDWEVELGVVIGKTAKYVSRGRRAGPCRRLLRHQRRLRARLPDRTAGQWTKGKSCDTFGPIGPWLVTKDEVPDPQNLAMWLDGQRRDACRTARPAPWSTASAFLVSYLSQFMTLHPGDIISTGTPPGVGMGQKPPRYLKAGDVVELGIEGLGQQRQTTRQG